MRECGWCGRLITPRRTDAKYCSGAHRVAAHRAQKGAGGIPVQLLCLPRWVRYAPNKVPLRINGQHASSTDPTTWSTYAEAVKSRAGVGLGFVLGDGIGCIDLDHCLRDGVPSDEALELLNRNRGAYVEVSPSGDGLHIWGLLPEQHGRRHRIDDTQGVEVYSTGRYITITRIVHAHGDLRPLDVTAIPVSASLSA